MTSQALLVAGALALALAAGLAAARRRWDAVTPLIWWREQRLRRRPVQILGRLAVLPIGVALLTASTVAALLLLGVLLAGVVVAAALLWAWWRLRRAAYASAPRLHPSERDDVDPDLDPSVGPGEPYIWPPGTSPAAQQDDPINLRALEW